MIELATCMDHSGRGLDRGAIGDALRLHWGDPNGQGCCQGAVRFALRYRLHWGRRNVLLDVLSSAGVIIVRKSAKAGGHEA